MAFGEKKTVIEVDSNDVDILVNRVYPFLKGYEFIPAQEANNYSSYTFRVRADIKPRDLDEWEKLKVGMSWVYQNHLIFDMLCKDGHIEPGEYVVKVSW